VIEKPYLDNWRHRVGREDADNVLRNAAEFGTKLHGAAQKVAWREPVEAEIEPYAAAVRAFLDKHVLEVAVRVKKNRPGEFYVRQFEDHREDVQAFLGLLEFWLWRHRAAVRRAS